MRTHGFDIEDYKDNIIKLYLNDGLTAKEIGDIYKVSKQCILRLLKRNDIQRRRVGIRSIKTKGENNPTSKCVIIKNDKNKVIDYFYSLKSCSEWLVDNCFANKIKSGVDAIERCLKADKSYKGLSFYNITKEQYIEYKENKIA